MSAPDFAGLTGSWKGTVRTWLDPEGEPSSNEFEGTFRRVFDGASILGEYRSSVGEHTSNGTMLIGKDIATGRSSMMWVDTFHTGGNAMTFDHDGSAFRGSYAAGDQTWRWRIVLDATQGELAIDHFNISPDGQEDRAVEVRCRRT